MSPTNQTGPCKLYFMLSIMVGQEALNLAGQMLRHSPTPGWLLTNWNTSFPLFLFLFDPRPPVFNCLRFSILLSKGKGSFGWDCFPPPFCLPLYFLPAVCTTKLLPWAFLFCHDLKRWYRTYSPDNCACAASLRQTPLKFTWPFQIAFFTTLPMKTLLSTAFVIQVHPSHFILVTQQSLKI